MPKARDSMGRHNPWPGIVVFSVEAVYDQQRLLVADENVKLVAVESVLGLGVQLGRRAEHAACRAVDVGANDVRRWPCASLVDLVGGRGIGIGDHPAQDVAAAEEHLALLFSERTLVVPRLTVEVFGDPAVGMLHRPSQESGFAPPHRLGARVDDTRIAIGWFRHFESQQQRRPGKWPGLWSRVGEVLRGCKWRLFGLVVGRAGSACKT